MSALAICHSSKKRTDGYLFATVLELVGGVQIAIEPPIPMAGDGQ
jgi:hypothetical protein